jgi:hypothetical protein
VLLATFGLERLWSAPFVLRLRTLTTPAAIAAAGIGLLYGGWTLVRRGHISRGTLLLIGVGAIAYAIGAATDRARTWRPIAAALVIFGAVQFAYFYRDYLVDYPKRSAGWYMNNRRDALQAVFREQAARHAPKVFVSTSIQYAESYWRLYTLMDHREDLQTAMVYFDPAVTRVEDVPEGALVLLAPTEAARADRAFAQQQALVPLDTIADPDGSPAFLVLQKSAPRSNADRPSSRP